MQKCRTLAHTLLLKWETSSDRSAHSTEHHHLHVPHLPAITFPSPHLTSNYNSIANTKGFKHKHQVLQLGKSQKREHQKILEGWRYIGLSSWHTHAINCCSRQWRTDLTAPVNVLQPCNLILQPPFLYRSFLEEYSPCTLCSSHNSQLVLTWTDCTYTDLQSETLALEALTGMLWGIPALGYPQIFPWLQYSKSKYRVFYPPKTMLKRS